MKTRQTARVLYTVLFTACFTPVLFAASIPPNWPQFRGPNASGVADGAKPPIHFGPTTHLRWKTAVPAGVSSPIVWGDRVFVTALAEDKLVTLAFDCTSGRELWRRVAPTDKIERCHGFSSPAASTPCTDGERVYAYFGSYGVIAYDFEGKEAWRRPFARLPIRYGTSTSPILAGGHLILQRDGNSADAQLIALAPMTGETVWESPRPTAGACYSTPMVWQHHDVEELIVQGKGRVAAYSLDGNGPKWWVRGWGYSAVTTPVAGDDMLFAGGAGLGDPTEPEDPLLNWDNLIRDYDANGDGQLAIAEIPASLVWHQRKEVPKGVPGSTLSMQVLFRGFVDRDKNKIATRAEWDADVAYATDKFNADRFVGIRPGGETDSTDSHVKWETTQGLSEMPSALFYRGRLHFIENGGKWSVVEPKTGKRLVDRERLGAGGQAVASPVAANGHIYVVNARGTVTVLRAGDTLDVVARNKLGERVRTTPAIAGDALYVRTAKHLWAFAD